MADIEITPGIVQTRTPPQGMPHEAMSPETASPEAVSPDVLSADEESSSRALVVVTSPATSRTLQTIVRPDPSFIVQLLATRDLAPQTRARHRIDPEQAEIGYRRACRTVRLPDGGLRMSRLA
jgi:hypothetical protein